jgi:hypothetical protein
LQGIEPIPNLLIKLTMTFRLGQFVIVRNLKIAAMPSLFCCLSAA